MKLLAFTTAALLMGASSFALAQQASTSSRADFGAEVSALAKGQAGSQNKGIGATVSENAKARATAAADANVRKDSVSKGHADLSTDSGIGSDVSALAKAQRESDDKGLGTTVSAMAK